MARKGEQINGAVFKVDGDFARLGLNGIDMEGWHRILWRSRNLFYPEKSPRSRLLAYMVVTKAVPPVNCGFYFHQVKLAAPIYDMVSDGFIAFFL